MFKATKMELERYKFLTEWFDTTIKVKREFLLTFYPADNSVEMYDLLSKRPFLRRIRCETVDLSDIYVGSNINVLSRRLYITGFGDQHTADRFTRDMEITIVIINSSGFKHLGRLISVLEKNGMTLSRGRIIDREKSAFNQSSFSQQLEQKIAILEVRGLSAIDVCNKMLHSGATSFGVDSEALGELRLCCLGPSDKESAKREINVFFPPIREIRCNTATYKDATCCIIKPHAVREEIVGTIMQEILDAGFQITAMEILTFDQNTASEFHEVYKGVVEVYKDMVAQLTSGPCIAMEISQKNNPRTVSDFRMFVGPSDPEIARKLRPNTLRALYGHDKVKNSVHCTDLAEDANLELDFVFKVLSA